MFRRCLSNNTLITDFTGLDASGTSKLYPEKDACMRNGGVVFVTETVLRDDAGMLCRGTFWSRCGYESDGGLNAWLHLRFDDMKEFWQLLRLLIASKESAYAREAEVRRLVEKAITLVSVAAEGKN